MSNNIETWGEVEDWLMRDGNLRVPLNRFGYDTASCASVAYAVGVILASETGEHRGLDSFEEAMGLVVNGHDDVAYLIRNYGAEYGFAPEDYLDEYDLESEDEK